MITNLVLPYVLGILSLCMVLALLRLLRGPDTVDRVLALDTLYILALALLILLEVLFHTTMYFEAAVVIAMLGFIGTVCFSKFLLRRDLME